MHMTKRSTERKNPRKRTRVIFRIESVSACCEATSLICRLITRSDAVRLMNFSRPLRVRTRSLAITLHDLTCVCARQRAENVQ